MKIVVKESKVNMLKKYTECSISSFQISVENSRSTGSYLWAIKNIKVSIRLYYLPLRCGGVESYKVALLKNAHTIKDPQDWTST